MNLPQSAAAPAPCSPHLTAVLQNKVGLPSYVLELCEASRLELQIKYWLSQLGQLVKEAFVTQVLTEARNKIVVSTK